LRLPFRHPGRFALHGFLPAGKECIIRRAGSKASTLRGFSHQECFGWRFRHALALFQNTLLIPADGFRVMEPEGTDKPRGLAGVFIFNLKRAVKPLMNTNKR